MKLSRCTQWLCGFSMIALFAGCGSSPAGTYSVGETISNCSNAQTNLNVTETGSTVNGTGSNACYNESLNGTDSGGTMTGVTMTLSPTSSASAYPYGSYGYGTMGCAYGSYCASASTSCVYTGTLTYGNNVLSGTLTLQSGSNSASCPPNITLNGTKTS